MNRITFVSGDKPDNMGAQHTFSTEVLNWAKSDGPNKFLKNPKVEKGYLTFDIADGNNEEGNPKVRRGKALIDTVPDDFIPA